MLMLAQASCVDNATCHDPSPGLDLECFPSGHAAPSPSAFQVGRRLAATPRPPPPKLPPIPLAALLGDWTHSGDGSIVTVARQGAAGGGLDGAVASAMSLLRTPIVFHTTCKPCCFKSGFGTVSADGRHFAVNASSPHCVRLAAGAVYEGATNMYIRWTAHSLDGKPASWQQWTKHK